MLSVVRAIFSPLPSPPIRFSTGTRTLVNEITALASARSPMKWQRCSTFTPGESISTTKALIFLPLASLAMTTRSDAMVPLVHQSLLPFRM